MLGALQQPATVSFHPQLSSTIVIIGRAMSDRAHGPWSGAAPEASPVAWGAIATLAWATSIIGYIGWYWALARGGIARIGTIQFLQPLSGLVLAYFLLAERPSLTLIAATALILTGVVVARSQPLTAR